MNYYIQGCAANAERIKAAFEAKAILNGCNLNFTKEDRLFYSCDGKVNYCSNSGGLANIIKTHPDYKELSLPKPHYDIKNFHVGMPVLVRADNVCRWDYSLFSRITGNEGWTFAVCNGVSFSQCIPFEGNEHLLGTTDPCDEQYINW